VLNILACLQESKKSKKKGAVEIGGYQQLLIGTVSGEVSQ
jgi:hypothetical protein